MKIKAGRLVALCFCAVLAGGMLCQHVSAAITYSFGSDQASYLVAPGGTVDVDIFLQETVTGGDSSLLVAQNGLQSAQVTLERIVPDPTDPTTISSYVANTTGFDDLFSPQENSSTATLLDITQFADILGSSGPDGVDVGGGVRRVPLLTATLQAGSVGGEVTTLRLRDNPQLDETLTWEDGIVLDNMISPYDFTVMTAIPEPSTVVMLLTLSGVGIGIAAFRRRKRTLGRDFSEGVS